MIFGKVVETLQKRPFPFGPRFPFGGRDGHIYPVHYSHGMHFFGLDLGPVPPGSRKEFCIGLRHGPLGKDRPNPRNYGDTSHICTLLLNQARLKLMV